MALKRTGLFFFLVLSIYAIFIVPWPGVMDGYRSLFSKAGNTLFGTMGTYGGVTFEALPADMHSADMRIVLRNLQMPRGEIPFQFKSILIGYRPTAFLIALILATPVRWSRRWRSLLWGLVWVNVFVAFRMWLLLVNAYSNDNPMALYSLGSLVKGLLEPAIKVLFFSPAIHYTVPAFIWLIVTFRQGDLKSIFTATPRNVQPSGTAT